MTDFKVIGREIAAEAGRIAKAEAERYSKTNVVKMVGDEITKVGAQLTRDLAYAERRADDLAARLVKAEHDLVAANPGLARARYEDAAEEARVAIRTHTQTLEAIEKRTAEHSAVKGEFEVFAKRHAEILKENGDLNARCTALAATLEDLAKTATVEAVTALRGEALEAIEKRMSQTVADAKAAWKASDTVIAKTLDAAEEASAKARISIIQSAVNASKQVQKAEEDIDSSRATLKQMLTDAEGQIDAVLAKAAAEAKLTHHGEASTGLTPGGFKGPWDARKTYSRGDLSFYGGSTWIANSTVTKVKPEVITGSKAASAPWQLFASVGMGGGFTGGGSGGKKIAFTQLTDTPAVYGIPGQVVGVNPGGDGLTYVDNIGGGGSSTFAGLSDTPVGYGDAGQYVAMNSGGDGLEYIDLPASAVTFMELTDTPAGYGTAGQYVVMNSGGTGLEYADLPATTSTFIGLTDTPAGYGTAGQHVVVNPGGDGFEYVDAPTGGGSTTIEAMTDTPVGYGTAGQVLVVNPGGDGFVYGDGPVPDLTGYLPKTAGPTEALTDALHIERAPGDPHRFIDMVNNDLPDETLNHWGINILGTGAVSFTQILPDNSLGLSVGVTGEGHPSPGLGAMTGAGYVPWYFDTNGDGGFYNSGEFRFGHRVLFEWDGTGDYVASIGPPGEDIVDPQTIITAEKGDKRYGAATDVKLTALEVKLTEQIEVLAERVLALEAGE